MSNDTLEELIIDPYEVTASSLRKIINDIANNIEVLIEQKEDYSTIIRAQLVLEACALWHTGDLADPVEYFKEIFSSRF